MNDPIRCSEFSCPYCQSRDLTYILIPHIRRMYYDGPDQVREEWGETRDYTCQNCEYEWSALDDQYTEGSEPPGEILSPKEQV